MPPRRATKLEEALETLRGDLRGVEAELSRLGVRRETLASVVRRRANACAAERAGEQQATDSKPVEVR